MAVSEDFARLTDPFRPELLAHCYRMLGSVHDAEDQVQETMIRAWRSYGEFEGRASLRTWLYRIATNACLRALENSGRRPLPSGLGAPGEYPEAPLAAERPEVPWLQPIPDALVSAGSADPAEIVASRQGMRLALIAALQYLPARQRAVLILRDVLRWKAAEVAEAVGITTTAVNSILQRARAQLEEARLEADQVTEPTDSGQRQLLDRYVQAFEAKDVQAIVELFTKDAVWEMPPFTGWYQGPETIGRVIDTLCPAKGPGDMVLLPTRANGQPAFGVYMRGEDGVHRPFQLQVVDPRDGAVGHVACFFDLALFSVFGLPATLPPAD